MHEIQFVDVEKESKKILARAMIIWLVGTLGFSFLLMALLGPNGIILLFPIIWLLVSIKIANSFESPKEGLLTIDKKKNGSYRIQLKSPRQTLEFEGAISYELWIKKGLVSTGKRSSIEYIPHLSIILEDKEEHYLIETFSEEKDANKWGPIRETSPYLITGEYKLEREVLEQLIQIFKDDGIMPTAPTFKREA